MIALEVGIAITVILFAVGMPIYIVFALGGLFILMFHAGFPLSQLAQIWFSSLDSFILLAGPLFVLAGSMMVHSGIGKPLVNFLGSFTTHVPGGLAVASIIACCFMGALTGVNVATLAAVGFVMFPEMIAAGYDRGYSGAALCTSSNLGVLIPPSIVFILFGFLADTSVAKLFIGGIVPGVLLTLVFAITAIFVAKRKGITNLPSVSWRERGHLFIKALPGLFMPIIILGGIYGGFFTPTEAAAVACVYCFVIGVIINRKVDWQALRASLRDTLRVTTFIMALIAGAILLGKAFTMTGFTQNITSWVTAAGLGPTGFLFLLMAIVVVLGFFIDVMVMLFVMIPLVLPTVAALDINIIHLAVTFCIAGGIGVITPPMATHLYVTAGMFDIKIGELTRGVIPFLAAETAFLFIIIPFPQVSTWLPSLMN